MSRPPVTLNDIAREVHMSRATVSAVLNRNASCYASQKTKKLVVETAKRMGYVPNMVARSMRLGRSYTVGLLSDGLQLEIHSRFIVALSNRLRPSGYGLNIAYSRGEKDLTERLARDMLARGCDALVVHGHGAAMDLDFYAGLPRPALLLPYTTPLAGDYPTAIYEDHAGGVAEAYAALRALGHTEIHFFCYWTLHAADESRYRAFLRAASGHGVARPEAYAHWYKEDRNLDRRYLERFLARHPGATALMVMSDVNAMMAAHACAELGLRVPEDLSIVGFDGLELLEWFSPPLSTIRRDVDGLAAEAGALLMNLLENRENAVSARVGARFVARRSTGPARRTRPAAPVAEIRTAVQANA